MPTTTDFYATNDGGLDYSAGADWGTAHDAAAAGTLDPDRIYATAYWRTVDSLYYIQRGFMDFDTSTIGTDTVTSASVFLYGSAVAAGDTLSRTINIFSSNSSATLAVGDYDQAGTTEYATDIAHTSISVVAYNEFVMNATGIAAIDGGGTTKLSSREATFDAPNSAPGTKQNIYCFFYSSATAGTSTDPYLRVTYGAAATPVNVTVSYSPTASTGGGGAMGV